MPACLQETTSSDFKKERRRERSRDAARCRRHKESDTFQEISDIVPISHELVNNLDRSSVMRLVNSFIKLRQSLSGKTEGAQRSAACGVQVKQENFHEAHLVSSEDFVNALNGFLLVLSPDFEILYVSDNVKEYLGRSKLDLIGQSLVTLVHDGDHDEIRNCFHGTKGNNPQRSFFLRMKSTLTVSGKSINLKSASYKVLRCSGFRKPMKDDADSSLFIVQAQPIPHPANIEHFLDSKTFLTQHTPDMKFSYCDDRMKELLGYDESDLLGRSFFDYCHVCDIKQVDNCFQKLYRINQIETDHYRFLSKTGGYHWLSTQASLVVCPKNQKPQCIVCVHYIISSSIHPEIAYSSEQSKHAVSAVPFDVIPIENLRTDDEEKADIEEANKIVLEQDAYLEDLLKTPAPAKATAASTYGECRIVLPTFAATEENEGDMSEDMYFNAPYIGDPWIDSVSQQEEKLEDLFVDVTVENPMPVASQAATLTTSSNADNATLGLSAAIETPGQVNADQARRDFANLSPPLTVPEAPPYDLDKQLGQRCGSPCDSAYCGSPAEATFVADQPFQFNASPLSSPRADPADRCRPLYQSVVLNDNDFNEHMANLRRGFVGATPGHDSSLINRKRLHCSSDALSKLVNPSLPVPSQKRRCLGRGDVFGASGIPGKKAIPPAVQQVFNVLLQPGSSYGCTGNNIEPQDQQPLRSLFLQRDLFGQLGGSDDDQSLNGLLPELSLRDCEVNAPLVGSGKLPLGPDCVHALEEEAM